MVARLSPTNVIPEMLAPKFVPVKLASCQLELLREQAPKKNKLELELELTQVSKMDEATQNRIDKLFAKLDLSGCSEWTEGQ